MASNAVLTALALVLAAPLAGQAATPASKTVVRTQNDLPRHNYPVAGSAVELLNADDATFNAWAAKVNADVKETLEGYDIQDHATLRDLLKARLAYQVLTHQDKAGLQTIARIRAVEDKPDAKLLSAVRSEAILKARIATGQSSGPAYEKAYADGYAGALSAVPWAVASTTIKEAKTSTQIFTPSVMEGIIRQSVEPVVERDHRIGDKLALDMLTVRVRRTVETPLKVPSLAALTKLIAANDVLKPDIWAAREVTLSADDKLTPVVVAVWDSGTDLSLFPGRVYTDPDPSITPPSHVHGIAYDLEARPTTGWLLPLDAARTAEYPERVADFQGYSDLEQAIDSSAADALKAKVGAMPSGEVPGFLESMNFFANYLHGTHVAGIVARGNPAIRLASARITFDYRNVPLPPNDELSQRTVKQYADTVAWFRSHGVRVVNMSWGGGPKDYEQALELNGIGKDAAERKALARHYYDIDSNGLLAALKTAPEILFICSAGNSDADAGFDETFPAGLTLPNLLSVGAVDQAGDEASFTSYGQNVLVDANGYQVESVIPGGGHLNDSGTSMASPNVANLAAKLIALDPKLTPVETIRLIRAGATSSEDGRRHNIDPKASVAMLHL